MYPSDTLRTLSIDAGADFTCAVNTTNDGWCWGDGEVGQLGIGTSSNPGEPMEVIGGHKFTSIGTGSRVACGTSPEGMFCWGQRGDWSRNGAFTPDYDPAPFLNSTFNGYNTVAVGTEHGCSLAISGSTRAVDCWGIDSVGQMGIDARMFPVFVPFTIRAAAFGTSVKRVVAHDSVTCAERMDGTLLCAGKNTFGQLGAGSTKDTSSVPLFVGGSTTHLHGVSIGYTHGCALDDANHAFCWGDNRDGELGNNSTTSTTSPVQVSGRLTFRAIAAGAKHTCAIGTDNHIYCWGSNSVSQLGDGSTGGGSLTPWQARDPR
jgi:alpha-tubulin suppressor-like RCC1 family protein